MWLVFLNGPKNCQPAYEECAARGLKVLTLWLGSVPAAATLGDRHLSLDSFAWNNVREFFVTNSVTPEVLGFLAFGDEMVPLAGRLNDHFNKKAFYGFNAAYTSKNKLEMRKLLADTDLNPPFFIIEKGVQFEVPSELTSFGNSKWVLKPLAGHSSIGVKMVSSINDVLCESVQLFDATETLMKGVYGIDDETKNKLSNLLLLEKYVGGDEFSVEVICREGKAETVAICDKAPMRPPFFEERTYSTPAKVDPEISNRLSLAAESVVNRLGARNACAHLEFKVDGNKITFLDIGLRLGGGGLSHKLVSVAFGISLFGIWIDAALGKIKPLVRRWDHTAFLYLLQVREGGTISNLPNLYQNLDENVRLLEIYHYVQPGTKLVGYPNCSGLPGYVLFDLSGSEDGRQILKQKILDSAEKWFDPIYEETIHG
jgi:hypothetical protein